MAKILIIEDDPYVQRMYQRMFSHEEYEIFLASTGADGLQLASEKKPDLILLDIMLQDINGIEVLKKIRAKVETKSTKVIVLSNVGEESTKKQAMSLGVIAYMIKADFEPQQVIEAVSKTLAN